MCKKLYCFLCSNLQKLEMSRISKIFASDNSDNSDSDWSDSDIEDIEDIDDVEEIEEIEDVDENEEVEEDNEDENSDSENIEKEDEYNDNKEDEVENSDDEKNEEEKDSDKENSDEESDEINIDDYDDLEETGLLLEQDDMYADYKVDKIVKKSKIIESAMMIEKYKLKKNNMLLDDIRAPSLKFLEKLLNNKTNAERLEKSIFNFVVRFFKRENIPVTLKSREFKQKYSGEIYSVMSMHKSKMTFIDIKSKFDQDINHFFRGTFKKEHTDDEKKLRLITHVSEPVSGIHKCKCGCDKVYSYELQIRSGDEGMTVFLQCSSCGRKWRT